MDTDKPQIVTEDKRASMVEYARPAPGTRAVNVAILKTYTPLPEENRTKRRASIRDDLWDAAKLYPRGPSDLINMLLGEWVTRSRNPHKPGAHEALEELRGRRRGQGFRDRSAVYAYATQFREVLQRFKVSAEDVAVRWEFEEGLFVSPTAGSAPQQACDDGSGEE